MILVIGGRSKIGAALIEELLSRGERVRALVRAGERAGGLPAAAGPVTGDLADEASLVAAMDGIEKVFLLSSPHPDAVTWHRNAIDAARRTDVRLLVRSSILGADAESAPEFIDAHHVSDRYLRDSGLPHVIVRPNLFLQNIQESTIPAIDASGNFYVDAGQARISMVDTRDVAAVAAAALCDPGHAGADYDVTGPEALSYADVAAKLSGAHLYYRHVNQAERWLSVEMQRDHNGYNAAIPGDYTNSAFALQYYFAFQRGTDAAWLYPAFNATLSNQPYYAIAKRS